MEWMVKSKNNLGNFSENSSGIVTKVESLKCPGCGIVIGNFNWGNPSSLKKCKCGEAMKSAEISLEFSKVELQWFNT